VVNKSATSQNEKRIAIYTWRMTAP
jgi:hypothetical protein